MATLLVDRIALPDRDLSQTTLCLKVQFGAIGDSRKISSAHIDVDADKRLIRVSKKLLDAAELKAIRRFEVHLQVGILPTTARSGYRQRSSQSTKINGMLYAPWLVRPFPEHFFS
jgi:hypothetical protein